MLAACRLMEKATGIKVERVDFITTRKEVRGPETERQPRFKVSSSRERERRGKRESRQQASEAQREKERWRARARDKKQRRPILCEEQQKNFVAAVRK